MRTSSAIISPLPSILLETKVSELIDPNLITWKIERVKQMFLPHEASMILGIPLSLRKPPDRVVCAHTPSSEFSTSSAYKLLVASALVNNAGSSLRVAQKHFWKGVWQLHVPNKIKHFIWRVCNNALQTKSNLFRRQITTSNTCELCNGAPKDVLYAVWTCKELEVVWNLIY